MSSTTIKHPTLDYILTDNREDIDIKAVHAFLTESYWAQGIPLETVRKSIEGSLCFSVLAGDGEQVGFARVISDYATFAYIGDVYVIDGHRGSGLAKWMMEAIDTHAELQNLRRWTLATRDMHGLYRPFGFETPTQPEKIMEKRHPAPYPR